MSAEEGQNPTQNQENTSDAPTKEIDPGTLEDIAIWQRVKAISSYMNLFVTEEMQQKLLKDSQRQESVSKFLTELHDEQKERFQVGGVIMLALGVALCITAIALSIASMGTAMLVFCIMGAALTFFGGASILHSFLYEPKIDHVTSEIKAKVSSLTTCLKVSPDAVDSFNKKNNVDLNAEQYENFVSNILLLQAFIAKTFEIESLCSAKNYLLVITSLNEFFAKQDPAVKVFINAAASKDFTTGKNSAFKKYAELFAEHALKSHKMMKEVVEENTADKQNIDKNELFIKFVDSVIFPHYYNGDSLMRQLTTAYHTKKQNNNFSHTISEGSYKFSDAILKASNEFANGSKERYARQFQGSENMYNYR